MKGANLDYSTESGRDRDRSRDRSSGLWTSELHNSIKGGPATTAPRGRQGGTNRWVRSPLRAFGSEARESSSFHGTRPVQHGVESRKVIAEEADKIAGDVGGEGEAALTTMSFVYSNILSKT